MDERLKEDMVLGAEALVKAVNEVVTEVDAPGHGAGRMTSAVA